jgi:hypothetical protein
VAGGISCTSNLSIAGNITYTGTLTGPTLANSSYCVANVYSATSFPANTTTDLVWGALSLNTSDITHTTNTAIFSFANAGIYQVSFSLIQTTNTGTPYTFVSLMRSTNSGSTWSAYTGQGSYNTYSWNFSFTFNLVSIAAGDQWKLSLWTNAIVSFEDVCGPHGLGQAGSIPCSYVQFNRVA